MSGPSTSREARVHTQPSNRANASLAKGKSKAADDRRVVYKPVLENPHQIKAPTPLNVQNSLLACLADLLPEVAEYHFDRETKARRRKSSLRAALHQAKVKGESSRSSQAQTSNSRKRRRDEDVVDDPKRTKVADAEPNDQTSLTLSSSRRRASPGINALGEPPRSTSSAGAVLSTDAINSGTESSPPVSSLTNIPVPSLLKHCVFGINEVTKRLESQIHPNALGTTTAPVTSPKAQLRFVIACRTDVDPPILIDHLPALVAACNSAIPSNSEDRLFIKLATLPMGGEHTLAEVVGLRRVAVMALDVETPGLERLESVFSSITPMRASWLAPPSNISREPKELVPTHVKQLKTSASEMLSDDESDISNHEDTHQLTINEHYAKAFEYRKEREELAKLKEKYGSDFENEDESDSESDESEDEYGEELTPAVDAALLRTLAKIRRKDPEIYDSNVGVFDEEAKRTQGKTLTRFRPTKDKSKPLTIKQQNLAALLESDSTPQSPTSKPVPLTHAQEQAVLRDETISAFHNAVREDDVDDLLTLREGIKDEAEQREEEYREFLQREVGEDISRLLWVEEGGVKVKEDPKPPMDEQTVQKEQKKKKGKRKERKEETDEEFLMNYILNRGWIDKSENRAPTYKEVVGVESKAKAKEEANSEHRQADEVGDPGNSLLDDDEFDEVADHFESTYNFRFEEPNAHIIATHPRNVTSVRRTDTTRKDAREKRKERKAEKLLAKQEEVKRLKSLKMREVKEKLEKIRMEGGLGKSKGKQKAIEDDDDEELGDYGALGDLDLDGDWDPDQHDAQMKSLYAENEEYEDDDQKPIWNNDIDISDLVPEEPSPASEAQAGKKKKRKKRKHDEEGEDAGVDPDEMDAEVERPEQEEEEEEWDGTEEMRKRVFEKYMDEINDLEFNDMVGDMPTHFRYARVDPSTYGLTPVEILNATDAELNTYMGLKRLAAYRKDKFDYRRPEKLREFRNTLDARGVPDYKGAEGGERMKKRKGKKERQKEKAQAAMEEAIKQEAQTQQEEGEPSIKKRKRKHKKGEQAEAIV
ncbi:Kri1 family protein, partial [Rhizoctonia solani AG-3 Rhs1AP]